MASPFQCNTLIWYLNRSKVFYLPPSKPISSLKNHDGRGTLVFSCLLHSVSYFSSKRFRPLQFQPGGRRYLKESKQLTHLKRPLHWERLQAEQEGVRGWDGWMASPMRRTWIWANAGRWWGPGRPGVLQPIGSWRVRHNWATEKQHTVLLGVGVSGLSAYNSFHLNQSLVDPSWESSPRNPYPQLLVIGSAAPLTKYQPFCHLLLTSQVAVLFFACLASFFFHFYYV